MQGGYSGGVSFNRGGSARNVSGRVNGGAQGQVQGAQGSAGQVKVVTTCISVPTRSAISRGGSASGSRQLNGSLSGGSSAKMGGYSKEWSASVAGSAGGSSFGASGGQRAPVVAARPSIDTREAWRWKLEGVKMRVVDGVTRTIAASTRTFPLQTTRPTEAISMSAVQSAVQQTISAKVGAVYAQ